MNILEKIIEQKRIEVANAMKLLPVEALRQKELFNRKTFSLSAFLQDRTKNSIIAEFKRHSPSKGIINDTADIVAVTKDYTAGGACCISVLTDGPFFGGSNVDLEAARINDIPILRKDFIIDEYQLIEARAIGADVILLIAACLSPLHVKELASFAKQLQMEVLLEIHNEDELGHICDEVEIVGVNNRDLATFTVDINRSIGLAAQIPADKIKIAESGISTVKTINILREAGFKGFLIGERFMKEKDPGDAFRQFIKQIKQI